MRWLTCLILFLAVSCMAEHRLTGDPEIADNGMWIGTVTGMPGWTAADEGRFLYDLTTNVMYYGTDTAWVALDASLSPQVKLKFDFGTGSDLFVDIDATPYSAGPITNNKLTRDAHFTDLTLSGGDLDTGGYRLFVRGTLTIGSGYKVHRNGANGLPGGNATGVTGGAAGSGASLIPNGTMTGTPGSANGGKGGNGGAGGAGSAGDPGAAGGNVSDSIGYSGHSGADGGDGGTPNKGIKGSGGAGGTAFALPMGSVALDIYTMAIWRYFSASTVGWLWGSAACGGGGGGGGGGATPVALGGGGGGGGGAGYNGANVLVAAYEIVDNNVGLDGIQAAPGVGGNGGNGADGVNPGGPGMAGGGGGGGGGCGGMGGIVVIITASAVSYDINHCHLNGGNGGAGGTHGHGVNGGSDGANGGNGNAGASGLVFLFCQEP
jgi:hypothetical protein